MLGALVLLALLMPPSARSQAARGAAIDLPASPTLVFGDARLATGIRMRYAERGDPAGPAIILLHGYSDTWFSFSRILDSLPATLRVIAVDQRGHGASDQPRAGYHLRDLAADVLAFMDVRQIERATIVGHSMGSLVAQQVAIAAPARVERLVLVGSGTALRRATDIHALGSAVAELTDPVPVEFIRAFQESTVHTPMPPEFMNRVIDDSRRLSADTWRQLFDGMMRTGTPHALAAASVPTLMVWGDHDSVFPRSEQDALLALIPGSRLEVFEDTGHAPHWERPALFARVLSGFIACERASASRR